MSGVRVVSQESVDPLELPGGSWSRMLLTDERLDGNAASLGYSVFRPGTVTAPVCHAVEEVAYVISGAGELRLDGETVPFSAGDGLHIPAGIWHAVANTSDTDMEMVFGFPHPAYPPTERRD